jgi:hypothetical protein
MAVTRGIDWIELIIQADASIVPPTAATMPTSMVSQIGDVLLPRGHQSAQGANDQPDEEGGDEPSDLNGVAPLQCLDVEPGRHRCVSGRSAPLARRVKGPPTATRRARAGVESHPVRRGSSLRR